MGASPKAANRLFHGDVGLFSLLSGLQAFFCEAKKGEMECLRRSSRGSS
jgi:hypothetical protein